MTNSLTGILTLLLQLLWATAPSQASLQSAPTTHPASTSTSTSASSSTFHQHQVYLDVEPADTEHLLKVVRSLDISTYRLSYERSSNADRLRIGAIGPQVAELVPDAVELVPKRVLPPMEKGGDPVVLRNVPVVDDNVLFMYGVGATQELIRTVDSLQDQISQQIDRVMHLVGETAKLEHIVSKSSDGEAELRLRASIAQAEIARTELDIEMRRTEDEKEHLRMQEDREMAQIQRNEELTLARLVKEEEMAKLRAEEEMMLRFEASRTVERTRSQAADEISMMNYEREVLLREASEEMKVRTGEAIAKAKAEAERANEDVHIRKMRAEAEQSRKRNIAAINAIANHVASSLHSASKNPKQVFTFIWYIALLATGIYSAREIARLCRLMIESTLGKPKLIRETTRKSMPYQLFCDIVGYIQLFCQSKVENDHVEDFFEDVALHSELKKRVLSLASAATKVRKNDAPHRHILFYGQPGTGKTMVARKMAKSIGLDYALMSGGDVGPLGPDAVTQIHNLFRWAKFSKKGVMLFIDEAEAFLGDRSKNAMSEDAHNALNALLYNTGSECRHFMMVLATNRAEDLDAAILDRCDETLLFPLPDIASRRKLVVDYFNLFVRSMEMNQDEGLSFLARARTFVTTSFMNFHNPTKPFRIRIETDAMNEKQISSIVEATDGFSGREIAKLFIAIQGSVYASFDGALTSQMIDETVSMKVDEHKVKLIMRGQHNRRVVEKRGFKSMKDTGSLIEISSIDSVNHSDLSSDLEYEGGEVITEMEIHDIGMGKKEMVGPKDIDITRKIRDRQIDPSSTLAHNNGVDMFEKRDVGRADVNVPFYARNPLLTKM